MFNDKLITEEVKKSPCKGNNLTPSAVAPIITKTQLTLLNNSTEVGRHKSLSSATIYKMQAELKQLLKTINGSVPLAHYQDMYAKIINLNKKETMRLYDDFQSGKEKGVIDYLKKGVPYNY